MPTYQIFPIFPGKTPSGMKKAFLLSALALLLCSHDMYLKLSTYFLPPDTEVELQLFNGTFQQSDNVIDRSRMQDVSLVGRGERLHPDTAQWSEEEGATLLSFRTGAAGTWVAGVSTRPRRIELAAEDFNDYLEHDGVLDMLEARRDKGVLDQDAVEKYAKHVKAIFQVGEERTDDWQAELGYPIEFVPLQNPYGLREGQALKVKLLWQGEPLAGQLVYANSVAATHTHEHTQADGTTHSHTHEHTHADGSTHSHAHEHATEDSSRHTHSHDAVPADSSVHQHEATSFRTDERGVFTLPALSAGIWYLRTIYLVESGAPGLTHESNWATLTFEIPHTHEPAADAEPALGSESSYVLWAGLLLLIVGLGVYEYFRRRAS